MSNFYVEKKSTICENLALETPDFHIRSGLIFRICIQNKALPLLAWTLWDDAVMQKGIADAPINKQTWVIEQCGDL